MKTFDFSFYILTYNFVIGILLMLSSEKIGAYAGHFTGSFKEKIAHLTHIGILTFGACVAVLTAGIYLAAYIL